MANTNKKPDLAWLVQVEESFGTRFIRAHVVLPHENGELHSPRAGFFEPASAFAELEIQAYLGDVQYPGRTSEDNGKVWGLGFSYRPHQIETADRAREIGRTLDRITRGIAKLTTDNGYVADDDFATYLSRIGAVLGIRTYYVRNSLPFGNGLRGVRENGTTGENWRKVTVPDLQWFVREVSKVARDKPQDMPALIRDGMS